MQHHEEGDCIRFKDQIVAVCIGSPGHTSTTEKEGSGIHTVCSYKYVLSLSFYGLGARLFKSTHTHTTHMHTYPPPPPPLPQWDFFFNAFPHFPHSLFYYFRCGFPGTPPPPPPSLPLSLVPRGGVCVGVCLCVFVVCCFVLVCGVFIY